MAARECRHLGGEHGGPGCRLHRRHRPGADQVIDAAAEPYLVVDPTHEARRRRGHTHRRIRARGDGAGQRPDAAGAHVGNDIEAAVAARALREPLDDARIPRAARRQRIHGVRWRGLEDLDLAEAERLGTVTFERRAAIQADGNQVAGSRQEQRTVRVGEITETLEQPYSVMIFDEQTGSGIESRAHALGEGFDGAKMRLGLEQLPRESGGALACRCVEQVAHVLDDGKRRVYRRCRRQAAAVSSSSRFASRMHEISGALSDLRQLMRSRSRYNYIKKRGAH